MKTPRELLLSRHRQAEASLDAVRAQVVASLERPAPARRESFFSIMRAVFALPRPVWGALAAAWLVIVALNVACTGPTNRPVTLAAQTPASRQALAEQRRLFVELVHPTTPAVASALPRPRSDRRPSVITV